MVIVIVYYDSTKISDCIHVVVDQSSILTRAVEGVGAAIEEEALEDLERNADLYVFNQDDMQDKAFILNWNCTQDYTFALTQ